MKAIIDKIIEKWKRLENESKHSHGGTNYALYSNRLMEKFIEALTSIPDITEDQVKKFTKEILDKSNSSSMVLSDFIEKYATLFELNRQLDQKLGWVKQVVDSGVNGNRPATLLALLEHTNLLTSEGAEKYVKTIGKLDWKTQWALESLVYHKLVNKDNIDNVLELLPKGNTQAMMAILDLLTVRFKDGSVFTNAKSCANDVKLICEMVKNENDLWRVAHERNRNEGQQLTTDMLRSALSQNNEKFALVREAVTKAIDTMKDLATAALPDLEKPSNEKQNSGQKFFDTKKRDDSASHAKDDDEDKDDRGYRG